MPALPYNDDVDQGWRRRIHSTGRTIITIKAAGNAIHVMRKTEAALRGRTHDNTNATITARASIVPAILTMVSLPRFIWFPFGEWLVTECMRRTTNLVSPRQRHRPSPVLRAD